MIRAENDYTNRALQALSVAKDVIVVGAGPAGLSAALAAARQGCSVALVTDRPVLGGSASSEIRVGPSGAASQPHNRFARETGIIEEIFNRLAYRAAQHGKWRWFDFDELYFDMVMAEPNIALFLNTTIIAAERSDDFRIVSATGVQMRSEKEIRFTGPIFIDCSGDGTLGFLAGADYRFGREAQSEYQEQDAPEVADARTMGATLLFTSVNAGHPVPYQAPAWAIPIHELPSIIDPEKSIGRSITPMPDGTYYGFWWVEYGGQVDSIHDDDAVIFHLRRLVHGVWDYIKNSGKFGNVENLVMDWIGYLPGKRESRRLLGPHICTSVDFYSQRSFDDRIGYTGWSIDMHPPQGYLDEQPACHHGRLPGITDIPFRALYSRNITNLLFAGRDVSCSHLGLGTLRVIPTGAVMGQAAGTAAALCVARQVLPAEISARHIDELQRTLARHDQSMIGYRLLEETDLSRTAQVTASSTARLALPDGRQWYPLLQRYGLVLPVQDRLETISFTLKVKGETDLVADIYRSDSQPQNYRLAEHVGTVSVPVSADGTYALPVHADGGAGQKLFILFRKNPSIFLRAAEGQLTGVLGIIVGAPEITAKTAYSCLPWVPCFTVTPEQELYSPEQAVDGYTRPFGLPHLWVSAPMQRHRPEWLELTFREPRRISSVELVFNSELNDRSLGSTRVVNQVKPPMVKDYEVQVITPDGMETAVQVRDNYLRFRQHAFAPVMATGVRLVVQETWGGEHAELFDIRVYE